MTNTEHTKTSAMTALRGIGVATVKIEFSGGNDEGGADAIVLLDAEGNPVDGASLNLNANAYPDQQYENGRWVSKGWAVSEYVESEVEGERGKYTRRPATGDEVRGASLRTLLERPIYDEYGSFAGEFEVYGTLTWDVATGEAAMSGQVGYMEYNSF